LETLFPDRDFTKLPVSQTLADAAYVDTLRDSLPLAKFDRRQNHVARERYEKHKARKAANAKIAANLREANRELRTNPTTGIPNKRAFFEGELPKYVASIDIDSLKYVNDNMGHAAGDDLLRIAARVLAKNVDAYHVSGDEIWAKGNDREALEKGLQDAVAELRSGAYQIVSEDAVFSKPGFSYGVSDTDATKGEQHEILEQALKRADLTMLDQKEAREKTGERAPRGEAPAGFVRLKGEADKTTVPQRPITDNFKDADAATAFLVNAFGPGVTRLVKGGVVTFTQGKDTWPEAAQKAARGDEHAVYLKGRVYIDLNAVTREALPGVLLHEIGEHYHLARMLGTKAYAALQNQIKNQAKIANSPTSKVWAEVKRNYPHLEEGGEHFTAEVIAKLGERYPKMPWYRRLLAQIKSFLINLGLGKAFIAGTMTDKDLHALLVTSLKSAAKRDTLNEARLYDSTRDEDREVRMSRKKSSAAWSPERIDALLRRYAYTMDDQKTKAFAAMVSPDAFLAATTTPEMLREIEQEAYSLDTQQLADERQPITLYGDLENSTFHTDHHEGRHRMVALRNAGVKEVPVVFDIGRGTKLPKDMTMTFASGQTFDAGNGRGFSITLPVPINYENKGTLAYQFGKDADVQFSRPDLPDTINIDGKDRHTRNSKGQPIHSTEEGIRNFYEWFGDSKVVDEQGRPQVLYHGTTADFSKFDLSKAGQKDHGFFGSGIYLTPDSKVAGAYSDYDQDVSGQSTMPVYAKIENPYQWKQGQRPAKNKDESDAVVRNLKTRGHDGVFAENVHATEFADRFEVEVFEPSQIKSASGNNGAFSAADEDIRFSRPDTDAPADDSYYATQNRKITDLQGNRITVPHVYYRGERAADVSNKSVSKNPVWDAVLFASSREKDAQNYAGSIGRISLLYPKPEARILYEGTKEFVSLNKGNGTAGKNLLQWSAEAVERAKQNGYDAVWFKRQGDVGTAIINRNAFSGTDQLVNSDSGIRFSRPDILNVDGVDRPTVNSDGKPIHTTEEGIRNFWKWFGDSKVVDTEGRPKVVYHGTPNSFDEFKVGGDDPKKSGYAMWLGTDPNSLQAAHNIYKNFKIGAWKEGANIVPAYVKMSRPLVLDADTTAWARSVWGAEFPQIITKEVADDIRSEYDGVLYYSFNDIPETGAVARKALWGKDKLSEVVAFTPNQIKSATGNTGAFSPDDADIRFSRPDTEAPASEPKEPSTWDKTKTKLANMGDAAFSERLAFLSAIQVADIAEKIIPYAKSYIVGMRNRRREIDTWLRKADQTVSKWRGLSYAERTALNKTVHGSTLADMDVSQDWTGIKETEVPSYMNPMDGQRYTKKYYAYTQAVLSTNAAGQLEDLAGRQALKVTKNGAEFSTSEQAAIFLDKLRAVEQTGGLPTNVARKEKFDALRRDYAALPDKAKEVYRDTNAIHGELFEAKMAALEERIQDAIIDKAKASELIQSMRAQFESGSLNWYYAPLSRFGKYWFYGVDKEGQNWFRAFESERGRNQAIKEFKQLNGATSIVGQGSKVKELLNLRTEGTSDAFILSVKQLLEDKLPKELSEDMADDIYQMYLSTLPDVSMRHNAQHRKGTLGFEEDALRSFGFAVHHGASQVANMTHGREMQKVLSEMEEAIHITEFPSRRADMERDIKAIEDLEENWEEWSVPGVVEDFVNDAETDTEIKYAAAIQKQFERVKDDEEPMDGLMYAREKKEHVLEIASQLNVANVDKATDILTELKANFVAMTMTNSTAMDQIAGFARQVGFTWMLGFGLSSGVMNMAQTPVVAIPIVMGKHGIVPTTKAFNAAYADFAKAVSIMFRKDANGNPTGIDADGNASMTQVYRDKIAAGGLSFEQRARYERLIQALERFKNDGTLSRTQTFDVIGVGQEGETYGGKMQEWSKKMGWMFHQAERANREITLVAAMNLALDQGMHIDDAMEYAKKVVDDAHGEYSPENAPRIFRGWLPSIALQFKKYPQMMLYLWGKTASDWLSGWKKLPPGPERDAAQQKSKEAFGTLGALFLAQVSVAGVFGLPMMGSLSLVLNALANAAGDDDEPEWDWHQELRVGATSLFGETAATALTTGLFNALTPANVGSRMSLAEPVFRPPLQELEGQDAATHYLAEMWGPFGGIWQRLFQSQKLMSDGHYMRAAEYAFPKAVGDVIKSIRLFKEDAQTINGEPLKDMSVMENLLQAGGFGSSELEKLYAERGYVKSAEAQLQERRKTIQHSAARAKLEGTEYPMADVVAWNEKHPNWRITADTVKQAMDRIKENRTAKGERGYTVNPKLDYLIEENSLRSDINED
jgi:diguanylate cyclase (GGDEF)-like protein